MSDGTGDSAGAPDDVTGRGESPGAPGDVTGRGESTGDGGSDLSGTRQSAGAAADEIRGCGAPVTCYTTNIS